jgi:predicted transport protein
VSSKNDLSIPNEISKEGDGPIQIVRKQQVTQRISLKILEKDMEDLIIENPQKYLDEPGLQLISRQYSIGNYRFDLLFEDRHGGKLIVEIQRGTLDRNHTYKILDYYDEYKSKNPCDFVELMLVANKIKRERRSRLKSHGISFKEIPEAIFLEDFIPKENSEPIIIENTGIKRESINIFQKFLDVLNGHEGKTFSRSEIINLICLRFPGTNQTSLIPSDYCYNLINKGIAFQNHIFEQTELGKYKYLGEHYPYTGKVYWSKKRNPVGVWLNGVLIDDPVQNLTIKHPLLDDIREQQPHAQYLKFIDTAEKVEFVEKIHLLLCNIDINIERIFNKKEITYTNGTKFGCIVPQKNKIVVGPLLVKFTEIQDPQKLCRDIRDKTYASGGEIRADFREPYSEAEYAVFLLKQSLTRA